MTTGPGKFLAFLVEIHIWPLMLQVVAPPWHEAPMMLGVKSSPSLPLSMSWKRSTGNAANRLGADTAKTNHSPPKTLKNIF
jgi:hypothetical protein